MRRLLSMILVPALLAGSTTRLMAQEPAFLHFTDMDGLPSMTVYNILQDREGFIWISTTKGICRFDGKHFRRFSINGLSSHDTPFSLMDVEGIPWFYNLAGDIFYIHHDSLQLFNVPKPHTSSTIYSLAVRNPYIYITWSNMEQPLSYRYNIFQPSENLCLQRGYVFLGLKENELIGYDIATRRMSFDVYAIDQQELILSHRLKVPITSEPIIEHDRFYLYSNGNYATIATNHFRIFNHCDELISETCLTHLFNDRIKYITFINGDEVFISTAKSAYIFQTATKSLNEIKYFSQYINTIFEDAFRRRWVSTTDYGLYLDLNNQAEIFTTHNSLLPTNEISSIKGIDTAIYLGHNNGTLTRYLPASGRLSEIWHSDAGRIRAIVPQKQESALVASDHGIHLIRLLDLSISSCTNFPVGSFKSVLSTDNGDIYLSTSLGLYRAGPVQRSGISCEDFIRKREIDSRCLTAAVSRGFLYAGTVNGLFRKEGSKWINVLGRNVFVTRLLNYRDSLLFTGTDGEGLLLIDNSHPHEIKISTAANLPSKHITSLCLIDPRTIAIGTDNGIYIYPIDGTAGFGINLRDGLPGKEVLDIECKNGMLYAGTTRGLYRIPVSRIRANSENPYLDIENILCFSRLKSYPFSSLLPYNHNHLRLFVTQRSLVSGSELRSYYRLDPKSAWTPFAGPEIDLWGLSPGKYSIELFGINEDGISSSIVSKDFVIDIPWWKSLWFNALLLTGIFSLGLTIAYTHHAKKRREERRQRQFQDQLNTFREKALQNQMNPHFMFNALNAIQSFLSKNDQLNAMTYLSKFGKLIRMIFEQSKLHKVTLENEIIFLRNYLELENLRFRDKIQIELSVDPQVEFIASEILIPPLIIQPIAENSFKHGLLHKESGGIFKMHFSMEGSHVSVVIEDNGVGRKKADQINGWKRIFTSSTGIASTIERLKILDNGENKMGLDIIDLVDENGDPAGTRSIIKL